jgi:hypothetical protein
MEDSDRFPKSDLFLRSIDSSGARVIVSCCARCGSFLAASPDPKIIAIAEALHRCLSSEK